jgi:dienelactone hydrolase
MFPVRYVEEFKKRMNEAGARCECKTYEDAEHGFFYDLTREVQKEAFIDILKFVDGIMRELRPLA